MNLRKDWVMAEKDCTLKGAHLAYIGNGTEMDQLWRNKLL